METINEQIKLHFTIILKFSNYLIPLKAVQNDEISPFAAAQLLQNILNKLFSGFKCQLLPPSFLSRNRFDTLKNASQISVFKINKISINQLQIQ
jgi:hypothetical protein